MSTGRITDPTGRPFDLTLVSNSRKARRSYNGLIADARYRWSRLQTGGNYTLSRSWGNFNGENVGSGPIRSSIESFPEYREERWNAPEGKLNADQPVRVRLWGTYDLLRNQRLHHVTILSTPDTPLGTEGLQAS